MLTRYSLVWNAGALLPLFLFWTSLPQRRSHSFQATHPDGFPTPLVNFCAGVQPPLISTLTKCSKVKALTTFRINTYRSVDSKQLYLPLESTLAQKCRGVGSLWLTRISNFTAQLRTLSPSNTKPPFRPTERSLRVTRKSGATAQTPPAVDYPPPSPGSTPSAAAAPPFSG
jgi:hypothetical protein